MIGDLLSQLRNQYTLQNAPNNAPATGDPNGLTGLLQTSGVPMTQNPMGMRTPNYMGLLGMMGNQPPPWGAQQAPQAPQGTNGSYLDTVMGGATTPTTGAPGSLNTNNQRMVQLYDTNRGFYSIPYDTYIAALTGNGGGGGSSSGAY